MTGASSGKPHLPPRHRQSGHQSSKVPGHEGERLERCVTQASCQCAAFALQCCVCEVVSYPALQAQTLRARPDGFLWGHNQRGIQRIDCRRLFQAIIGSALRGRQGPAITRQVGEGLGVWSALLEFGNEWLRRWDPEWRRLRSMLEEGARGHDLYRGSIQA